MVYNDTVTEKDILKRTVKDSVFTDLFGDKNYLLQLYKALHPEDTQATEDDLEYVTISNVLTDSLYNDLGFTVGDRLIVLCEAQSTWSENIIIRSAMYLMESWQDYITSTKQNVYGSKKLRLPKPELYVIYTGDKQIESDVLSFSDVFMNGEKSALEISVNIISSAERNDIIGEYIIFCKVLMENIKKYGCTQKAIEETIRICEDRDVLKKYLQIKSREVVTIMMALYDQEQVFKSFLESLKYDSIAEGEARGEARGKAKGIAEGEARGKAEGKAEGKLEATISVIKNILNRTSMSAEDAMAMIGVPETEYGKYLSALQLS